MKFSEPWRSFKKICTNSFATNSTVILNRSSPDLFLHFSASHLLQGDPWKLKDALFKSASQLFELQYRTPWDGKKTLIDDPDVMNIRIPYSVVFDFEDYPLTEAAIIKRISLGAFRCISCNHLRKSYTDIQNL